MKCFSCETNCCAELHVGEDQHVRSSLSMTEGAIFLLGCNTEQNKPEVGGGGGSKKTKGRT